MNARASDLIRQGFWNGMGQIAAYSLVGLATGLIVLAFMPDLKPCPKATTTTDKPCGCGCGGN